MEEVEKGSRVSHGPCKHTDLQQIPSGQRMMGNDLEASVAPLLHKVVSSLNSSLRDDDPEPGNNTVRSREEHPRPGLQRALQRLVLEIPSWR